MADASGLAAVLRAKREAVIQRWIRRVREDPEVPKASRLSEPGLRDFIPRLLDRLIHALSEDGTEESGRVVGTGEPAQEHARERFALRYSLTEVLRELSHLRGAVVDLCAEEGVILGCEAANTLHAAIDEAMTTAAGEMERATREAQERFLGIMGHDMRDPVAAIIFSSNLLLKREDTTAPQAKALRRIATSGDKIAKMVNDLLDLTRIQSGGAIPIERRPADLYSICRHVIEELEVIHASRSIDFEVEGDPGGAWDPDRLSQVVSNLLRNALTYSPADTPVHVSIHGQSSSVVLDVTNYGPPIPPGDLDRIFEPFKRGAEEEGARRNRAGLGLGLFIAQQIVLSHGGSIEVRSAEGHGTTFSVTLPRG